MHHFVTEMCRFLLQNGALWDMAEMHSGICEMSLLRCMLWTKFASTSCEIAQQWMPQNICDDDKWKLVQVMAWWCLQTSHYLNQCWPRSMLPYGIIRQWANVENIYINYYPMWCVWLWISMFKMAQALHQCLFKSPRVYRYPAAAAGRRFLSTR